MHQRSRSLMAALAVAALAVAPAAAAKKGNGNSGKGKTKVQKVMYVFKGTYSGDSTVAVNKGNAHARKAGFFGTDVSFDFAAAKFAVADVNLDSLANLDDVQTGDTVLVQAKLPRKDPGSQPFGARKLVDQTNPPAEE